MKDICCIGHITRDKIVTPDHTAYQAGGTSYYMAEGISRLPRAVSFQLVTKVGDGQRAVVDEISQRDIDTICYPSRHTVYFENRYGADSNHRTQCVLAKADPFTMDDVRSLEAKVFHLGSLLADDFPPEVVEYLSTKGSVSIDVQGYLREVVDGSVRAVGWRDCERILPLTTYLKLNEHEMEVITSSRNPRTVAMQLADRGVREVIITLGSYGSLIYADGVFYEIPSYAPGRLVDATGCGDTYSTGYLWMRMQGAPIEEAGRFAAAMCTLKLEKSGPFDGTIADIHRVLRRAGRK